MLLISSSEFRRNQKKYFDIALKEKVGVKNGTVIFEITPSKEVYVNPSPSNDPHWDDPRQWQHIQRILDDIKSGKSKTIPWEEVKADLGL